MSESLKPSRIISLRLLRNSLYDIINVYNLNIYKNKIGNLRFLFINKKWETYTNLRFPFPNMNY